MTIYYKDFRYLKTFIERHSAMRVNIDALATGLQTVKTTWNQTHDHHIQQLAVIVGEPYNLIKEDRYDALNQHSIIKIVADKLFQREISELDKQLNWRVDNATRVSKTFATVIATNKLHAID